MGAWLVQDPNAPFPYHMYVFNADGTMQQANPDAGDVHGSDSDGKGIWVASGTRIKGKWVEVIAPTMRRAAWPQVRQLRGSSLENASHFPE